MAGLEGNADNPKVMNACRGLVTFFPQVIFYGFDVTHFDCLSAPPLVQSRLASPKMDKLTSSETGTWAKDHPGDPQKRMLESDSSPPHPTLSF